MYADGTIVRDFRTESRLAFDETTSFTLFRPEDTIDVVDSNIYASVLICSHPAKSRSKKEKTDTVKNCNALFFTIVSPLA